MSKKIENSLFNLKFAAKQYERQSKQFELKSKNERKKIKSMMQKGYKEKAEIHAENAVKFQNQSLRYARLASRVESAYNTMSIAVNMKMVSNSMKSIVNTLESTADFADMNKMTDTMNRFEKECENVNIRTEYMENALTDSSNRTQRQDQVHMLMQEVADEHGLEFSKDMDGPPVAGIKKKEEDKEFEERLRHLKEI